MDEFVSDTHELIWYFTDSKKLGSGVSRAFEDADNGDALIHISAVVLAEMYYANVKMGYPVDFAATYRQLDTARQFVLTPFDPEDVLDFGTDSTVSEMHDRMIVGLARRLAIPLLTVDQNIIQSGLVEVIW